MSNTNNVKSISNDLMNKIDYKKLPKHIAFIMDGNGRWGLSRGLARVEGHKASIEAIEEVVNTCLELGIKYLSLFCFSIENIDRPIYEVLTLFQLFEKVIDSKIDLLKSKDVCIRISGNIELLPETLCNKFRWAQEETKNNKSLYLNLAVMYSGREELLNAIRKIVKDVKNEVINIEDLDDKSIRKYFYQPDIPDPDLMIRTSGEQRISNFMMWQLAYSELYFEECYWPEYNKEKFLTAINAYQSRNRRFGKVKS